jgi:hypothetical protein
MVRHLDRPKHRPLAEVLPEHDPLGIRGAEQCSPALVASQLGARTTGLCKCPARLEAR